MKKAELKNLTQRYKTDTELLKKYPEKRKLLENRIKRHEQDILQYVLDNSD